MTSPRENRDDPARPRIFGIGLNKTGTTSLAEALAMLGYDCLHGGRADGAEIRQRVLLAADAGEPLLSNLAPRFDAFMDIGALSTRFHMLDEQYPGSRFILTVRPVEDWIDSRRRHVERNRRAREEGTYDGTFLEVDVEGWRRAWDRHMLRVRSHFAGRGDLLEMDLTDAPEWGPLCALLGAEVPEAPFPWVNRDGGGADRRAPRVGEQKA